MQVSWIDAERLKALVAQIAPLETSVEDSSAVIELDTAPGALPDNTAETWGFAMDRREPVVSPSPSPVSTVSSADESDSLADPADETDELGSGPCIPNPPAALPLSRIRDKLRAIRQRATDAGILTRVGDPAPKEQATRSKMFVLPVEAGNDDEEETGRAEEAVLSGFPQDAADGPPPAPGFVIPQGSREVRLAAFAGWARQLLHEGDGQMLVMSDDGEVLWGGDAKAGLVLSAMMACGAAIRASAMSASPVIHQPLASGNVLTVIPCETADGMVHAAVAAPAGLSQGQARAIRGALCAVMN